MIDKVARHLERNHRSISVALSTIACCWFVYQMAYVPLIPHDVVFLQNNHLLLALVLLSLASVLGNPKRWPLYLFVLLGGSIPFIYVILFYQQIEERNFFLTPLDQAMGVVMLITVIVAAREKLGWVLPSLATTMIIYAFLGSHAPGFLKTSELSFSRGISWLSIGFSGIYGPALAVSARYLFLFVIFGAILQHVGAIGLFLELGKLMVRKLRLTGGMGQTAVISSGLVGMLTGSAMANVAITGSFTIPAMKEAGYKPEVAGAIEAVASTGGQVIPPIMGAAAFVMVAFTGIPYIEIMAAAALPALAYVVCAGTSIELTARRMGMARQEVTIDVKVLLTRLPQFLIPLLVIILTLLQGLSPMFAAFRAVIALYLVSLVLKATRPSLPTLVKAITSGASEAATLAVACAVIGPIIDTLSFTGLSIKLPSMVEVWAGGSLPMTLGITAVICLILGTGMPSLAAYCLVAVAAAPALVRAGVPVLPAHLFVFFVAVASMITPPVAMACLVASGIAKAKYMSTGFQAVKIGIMIFLIPLLYAFNPIIIGEWTGSSLPTILTTLLSLFLGITPLCAAINGYYIKRVSVPELIALVLSCLGLWGYIVVQSYLFLVVGMALFILVTLYQLRKRKPQLISSRPT